MEIATVGVIHGEPAFAAKQRQRLPKVQTLRAAQAAPGAGGDDGDTDIHAVLFADPVVLFQQDFGKGLAGVAEAHHGHIQCFHRKLLINLRCAP